MMLLNIIVFKTYVQLRGLSVFHSVFFLFSFSDGHFSCKTSRTRAKARPIKPLLE